MGLVRPELAARLRPWREVMAAVAAAAFGAWVFSRGGLFFQPLGGLVVGASILWALDAARRRRFHRAVAAPGLVEIDEGAVRYYGARALGGELPLRELQEIRLMRRDGRAHWRLKTRGEALLIPLDAAGAGTLPTGFAALPGFDLARAAAALDGEWPAAVVWRRG